MNALRYGKVFGDETVAALIDENMTCVMVGDRLTALTDRLRELLRECFGTVFTVGDSRSLLEGAQRLRPALIVVDLALAEEGTAQLIRELKSNVPESRIIALTLYEDPAVAQAAMAEGADGVVLKRLIGDDLLPAIDMVLSGRPFTSSCFEADLPFATPAR